MQEVSGSIPLSSTKHFCVQAPTVQRRRVSCFPKHLLGQAVLDARAEHVGSTLADLYDPDLMPPNLRKAHHTPDKEGFACERERVEHLFMLYEKLVAPLEAVANAKVKKVRKTKNAWHRPLPLRERM